MMLDKPVRYRSPAHLIFVRCKRCCIHGCPTPHDVQGHHLTFVQPKARGLKAGDQWVVPLCLLHHTALHARGDERAWWAEGGRGGAEVATNLAQSLWAESLAAGRAYARPPQRRRPKSTKVVPRRMAQGS